MNTEFTIPLLWFLAGVISYRFAATVINYAHASAFIQEINRYALMLIGIMSEDIHFFRQRKYLLLKEAGTPENEINSIKEIDEKVFNGWKFITISRFFSVYPKYLHKLVPFKTWDEAMEELTKIHKKVDKETSN